MMVDYFLKNRRPALKRALVGLLERRLLNRVAVTGLRLLPGLSWRSRVPVVGGVGYYDAGGRTPVVLQRAEKCKLARELFWNRGRLSHADERIALELTLALCQQAELFLDIGAYSGLFVLAAARRNPRLRSIAYEIVPEIHQLLCDNVQANGLGSSVSTHLLGLGRLPGSIKVPARFGSGVLPSAVALDSQTPGGVEVPVSTLDRELPDFTGRLVCKIDVETFEPHVLQGGRNLVERTRPDLVCEVLPRSPRTPELQALLTEWGYSCYHITDHGLRSTTHIVPHPKFWNWLFSTKNASEIESLGFETLCAQNPSHKGKAKPERASE